MNFFFFLISTKLLPNYFKVFSISPSIPIFSTLTPIATAWILLSYIIAKCVHFSVFNFLLSIISAHLSSKSLHHSRLIIHFISFFFFNWCKLAWSIQKTTNFSGSFFWLISACINFLFIFHLTGVVTFRLQKFFKFGLISLFKMLFASSKLFEWCFCGELSLVLKALISTTWLIVWSFSWYTSFSRFAFRYDSFSFVVSFHGFIYVTEIIVTTAKVFFLAARFLL